LISISQMLISGGKAAHQSTVHQFTSAAEVRSDAAKPSPHDRLIRELSE
jgi:hypothetical protein